MSYINKEMTESQYFRYLRDYICSPYSDDLRSAYKSFSEKKYRALLECKKIQQARGGVNGKIISRNCDHFTYGFEVIEEDTRTLYVITPTYCYWYLWLDE